MASASGGKRFPSSLRGSGQLPTALVRQAYSPPTREIFERSQREDEEERAQQRQPPRPRRRQ